jgi:hypothetical protein
MRRVFADDPPPLTSAVKFRREGAAHTTRGTQGQRLAACGLVMRP